MNRTAMEALLDEAFKAKNKAEFSSAYEKLDTLERSSKNPADIAFLRLYKASCMTDLGRTEEASELMQNVNKALLDLPKQLDYEFEAARIDRAHGKLRDALAKTNAALKSQPSVSQETMTAIRGLMTLKAILLAELDRCDEAMPLLTGVPLDDAGWAEAWLNYGDCNYKQGQYQAAIDAYQKLVPPNDSVDAVFRNAAIRNIGCAYHKLGNNAQALAYLNQIKDAFDDYPELKSELMDVIAECYSHPKKTPITKQ